MKLLLLFILTLFTFSGALYSKTYSNININKTTEDGMSFKQNSDTKYMEIQLTNSQSDTITLKYNFKDREFNARPILRLEFLPKHKFKYWRVNSNKSHPAKLFRSFCFEDKEIIIDSELSHIRLHIMYNSKTLKAKVYIEYGSFSFYENSFVVKENPDEYFNKFFEGAIEQGYLKY